MDWKSYWKARNEDLLNDAETLKLDSNNYILDIGKRPDTVDEIEGQYMGLIKLTNKGASILKKVFNKALQDRNLMGKPVENAYMTDLLQTMIDTGNPIKSIPVHGEWVEIDTVSDLNVEMTCERLIRIDDSLKNK
jgi:choline kinase